MKPYSTLLCRSYGRFKRDNKRFGETAYSMNGRAPGFCILFVLELPHTQTTVVVRSNIYSSATTTIGYDLLRCRSACLTNHYICN